jgi:hypothetical protein
MLLGRASLDKQALTRAFPGQSCGANPGGEGFWRGIDSSCGPA